MHRNITDTFYLLLKKAWGKIFVPICNLASSLRSSPREEACVRDAERHRTSMWVKGNSHLLSCCEARAGLHCAFVGSSLTSFTGWHGLVGARFGQWQRARVSDKDADSSVSLVVHLLRALLQTFCQLYKLSAAIQHEETRRTLMTFYFVGSQGPHFTSGSLSKHALIRTSMIEICINALP